VLFYNLGSDVTSIPAHCCALPYILNGTLYYNCTVNPAFSNDLGCYHNNGQCVKCQQPAGMLRLMLVGFYNSSNLLHVQLETYCLLLSSTVNDTISVFKSGVKTH